MSMRISTNMFHSQGLSAIQNHQQGVLDNQLKLSSGKRVNAPSDDPVATAQIHSLNRTMGTIDQFAKNGEFAKAQLAQEETAVADVIESVQRARELAIQMSNGTYNAQNRQATAAEIGQIIDQMYSNMNYTSSEGEKLFAGSSVNADLAFVEDANNPGYYAYIGSPNAGAQEDPQANFGARFVQIGFDADNKLSADDKGDASRVRISDNGQEVFKVANPQTVFSGTGTQDANILNVLVEFKKALEAGDPPPAGILSDMDSAVSQLTQVRAEIGGRQNRIEAQYNAGESFKIALEERRMTLEDMDLVKGITELTQSQNALQMAQQVFTKVQGMTLFNYLR